MEGTVVEVSVPVKVCESSWRNASVTRGQFSRRYGRQDLATFGSFRHSLPGGSDRVQPTQLPLTRRPPQIPLRLLPLLHVGVGRPAGVAGAEHRVAEHVGRFRRLAPPVAVAVELGGGRGLAPQPLTSPVEVGQEQLAVTATEQVAVTATEQVAAVVDKITAAVPMSCAGTRRAAEH